MTNSSPSCTQREPFLIEIHYLNPLLTNKELSCMIAGRLGHLVKGGAYVRQHEVFSVPEGTWK